MSFSVSLPLLALFAAVAAFMGVQVWLPRRNHQVFVDAARRLGLPPPATPASSRMQWIRGEVRGVEVDIQTYLVDQPGSILRRSSRERPSTRTRVVAYGVPLDLNLRSQSLVDDAYQAVTGKDLQLGDDRFDREVVIGGDPHVARLALDATTRVLVLELFRHGGQVAQGRVEIDQGGTPWSAERLTQSAYTVINLASRLKSAAQNEADRIRRLITADPNPGVRRATLLDTLAHRPGLVAPLLPGLLTDRDLTLRILAAREVGPAARPVLVAALAESTEPVGIAAGLHALGGDTGADVEAIALLHLSSRSAEVQVAAAALLIQVGTARAVEPLTPLATGLTVDADTKKAARAALAAIRARLGPVEAGRLSMAAQPGGALSVAADPTGTVSLSHPNPETEE